MVTTNLETFLVGGAIRDRLLGLEVQERDWVVVGSSPQALLDQGFRQVGKDFPVFLHPKSGEEYALARTERKIGHGYRGFAFDAHPKVSLDEDLLRRDLTINAIAEDAQGQIHDPWGGLRDLELRLLRHVSPAFVEDPVRILRVARFASKFHPQGFRVAPETMDLMQQMVETGEVDHLVPERVFSELVKSLSGPSPSVFFHVLKACGALDHLFPELAALFHVPMQTHDGVTNAGLYTLRALEHSALLTSDPLIGFAVLTHGLGRARTNPARWPRHPGHERLGTVPLTGLCNRLKVPSKYRQLAERVLRYHPLLDQLDRLGGGALVDLLMRLDTFRQPESLEPFLRACNATRNAIDLAKTAFSFGDHKLKKVYEIASSVNGKNLSSLSCRGPELGHALRRARIEAVKKLIS